MSLVRAVIGTSFWADLEVGLYVIFCQVGLYVVWERRGGPLRSALDLSYAA